MKSDVPWKKLGTPGTVTVMDGVAPKTGAPGPATPPSREPRSWARLPSVTPSGGWPMEVVLVVRVVVCPEVFVEVGGGGGEVVENEESGEEVEKEKVWVWDEEEVVAGSPMEMRKTGQSQLFKVPVKSKKLLFRLVTSCPWMYYVPMYAKKIQKLNSSYFFYQVSFLPGKWQNVVPYPPCIWGRTLKFHPIKYDH